MRILIAEDDSGSQMVLESFLSMYGDSDIASDGKEALSAFLSAHEEGKPYDLICLDIMMPEMDGQETLREIRRIEGDKGIYGSSASKIIMTTGLSDSDTVLDAFQSQCDAYITKPIEREKLVRVMRSLDLC